MFDDYTNPSDAEKHLLECVKQPISTDYVDLLVKSYSSNVHLFKANLLQIIATIETFLSIDRIDKAHDFVSQIILVHFDSVTDIMDSLLRMFIRICPLVNINHRSELCERVLLPLTSKLGRVKCNKKLAPLFFDFSIVILDMCVIEAPKCAWDLLQKTDFYPWKELALRFKDLLRSCAAYDTIDIETYFSDLDVLEDIIEMTIDRAKAHAIIFQATHHEALQATFRWSTAPMKNNNKRIWCTHVYRMAQHMIELIDLKQVTIDICSQFIKALEQRIIDNEDDDNQEATIQMMRAFFMVRKI